MPPDTPSRSAFRTPTATLDEVDILSELDRRTSRAPDHVRQSHALAQFAAELALDPRNTLQRLAVIALDLCHAHSAGVSLLEGDGFRWEAVAGIFAHARNRTFPRSATPCGSVVDRDAMHLLHFPDRAFPALLTEPRIVESLLLPFHDHGQAVGTIWIASHSDDRRFDLEDARIVSVLTECASAAWQLWTQRERTEQNDQRKNATLAMVSHELRSPLSAITGAAEILEARVAGDEAGLKAVRVIGRQGRHAARLVDDLLDVTRIESGKLALRTEAVDVCAVVRGTIDARLPPVDRRRQQLTLDLGEAPVVVNADPVRVSQIVANLVDNAAKYTPDGGHIRVAVAVENGEVVVSVQDDGDGIPAEGMETIFEPFMQIGPHAAARGGVGLGLTLVRHLAELHGGSVHATSPGPGRGTCLTVRLPRTTAAA